MSEKVWLAADYQLPITYSCRMPMSSSHSAQCLPVPGPATVRLALIRTAIELFGVTQTRDLLFPLIQKSEVAIRPPKNVAISSHTLQLYKVNAAHKLQDSIGYREFAHAEGLLTVYIAIPSEFQAVFTELLYAVGYWGQGNSLAVCVQVSLARPLPQEVIQPLSALSAQPIRHYATAFLTEWAETTASWTAVTESEPPTCFTPGLFVLPLEVSERYSVGLCFAFCSLEL
jgi:hypothetical protein